MGTYRKKPVEIEAIQINSFEDFVRVEKEFSAVITMSAGESYGSVYDKLHGWVNWDLGDWIIQGVQGEHYPCKPDIFEATYEEVK